MDEYVSEGEREREREMEREGKRAEQGRPFTGGTSPLCVASHNRKNISIMLQYSTHVLRYLASTN